MEQPIKKTLLVTLDFPPQVGGVAAYYHNFCKNLPANQIVVLAPQMAGDEEFDAKQPYAIIRKPLLNHFPKSTSPKTLRGIIKLSRSVKWMSIIRHYGPIVKNHGIEQILVGQILPLGTITKFYAKRHNLPYLVFAHGLDITLPQNFLRKKTLLKNIISDAKHLIANSHFTKRELEKLGADHDKITVVYPCPDNVKPASSVKLAELAKTYDLAQKKVLLSVGRLVERKGHDVLISALPKIAQQVKNLKLLIVGDGPQLNILKNLVNKHKVGEYVEFITSVDSETLSGFYELCDVMVLPSRQLTNGDVEGFGIVYLEASLRGKPVIGGNSGGVPEAVLDNHSGLLVNPLDADEIAEAALKLLTDELFANKLGMQGLDRVTHQFIWQKEVSKIIPVLR